ncbi:MAG: T9SS type A sorting domain-containing protein, partial [Phaeodactylibacter sp.]|nr:T9SS type A sorting domain-containing protein [Phaeodactylibacter sp.]
TDNNGNSSSCNASVTVEDNIAPTAVCLNTTVYLGPSGQYNILETDVLDFANSSDNCSFSVSSISPAGVDCSDFETTVPVLVTISDPSGNSDDCIAEVYVDKSYALPAPWASEDIGNPGTGNTYQFDPCTQPPVFTIGAGAANNNLASDNIAFIKQNLCGDFSITTKVESITPNGYAGLMARESGATGSKMAGIYSNYTTLVRWEARTATNANKAVNFFQRPAPYWLRLTRVGNWVFGYYSFNGFTFSIVTAQMIPMNSCLEVGMASFSNIPGSTATAVFSNVSVSGGGPDIIQLPDTEVDMAGVARNISLFPNPARERVTLSFSELQLGELSNTSSVLEPSVTVQLRNQLGQLLEQRQLAPGAERLDWDVSHLNPGLYLIEVQEEGQAPQVLRFVKAE